MIAIKRKNGAVYWLDAVLSFSESYSGTVTKHQIEDGSSISDHIITDNAKFTISGVISECDFAGGILSGTLSDDQRSSLEISSQPNARGLATPLQIDSPQKNPLLKLVPDSIKQFIGGDSPPEVTMGVYVQDADIMDIGFDAKKEFRKFVEGFPVIDDKGNALLSKESVTIIEFDSSLTVKNTYDNCVCTSLSFTENPDSGDAVYPEMSFEQVRFVRLLSTAFPSDRVSAEISGKASPKVEKGNQPVAETEASGLPDKQGPVNLESSAFRLKNPDAPFGGL